MIMNRVASGNSYGVPTNAVLEKWPVAHSGNMKQEIARGDFVSFCDESIVTFKSIGDSPNYACCKIGDNRFFVASDSGSSSCTMYFQVVELVETEGSYSLQALSSISIGSKAGRYHGEIRLISENRLLFIWVPGTDEIRISIYDLCHDYDEITLVSSISIAPNGYLNNRTVSVRRGFNYCIIEDPEEGDYYKVSWNGDDLSCTTSTAGAYNDLYAEDLAWHSFHKMPDGRLVGFYIDYTSTGNSDDGYTYHPSGNYHILFTNPHTGLIEDIETILGTSKTSYSQLSSFLPSVLCVLSSGNILMIAEGKAYLVTTANNEINFINQSYTGVVYGEIAPNEILVQSDDTDLPYCIAKVDENNSLVAVQGTPATSTISVNTTDYHERCPRIILDSSTRLTTSFTSQTAITITTFGLQKTVDGLTVCGYSKEPGESGKMMEAFILN